MAGVEPLPDFVRSMPEIEAPLPGARGWSLQGIEQQVVFAEFEEDIEVPEHTHIEQWEFVLAGKVELRRNGSSTEHAAGDNFFIPAGQRHGAKVHAGYKAMIVFNSPDRYQARA